MDLPTPVVDERFVPWTPASPIEYGEPVVLTLGHGLCVHVYTPDQWAALESNLVTSLLSPERRARAGARQFLRWATEETIGKDDLLTTPDRLAVVLGLDTVALLVKRSHRIEIWDPHAYVLFRATDETP